MGNCFKFFSVLIVLFSMCLSVNAKDMKFVQVTDVNYQKGDESGKLIKVVNDINRQKNIEFVVFTGDNIAKPNKDDLRAFLKEIKKLKYPYYIIIGDRDVNKRKELSKKEYSKFVHKYGKKHKPNTPNYVFEKNGVVFVVADGAKDVIPSKTGYYKDDVMEWLDANLDLYSKKPVIILQHFPIVPPAEKESHYTFKADEYLQMLSKHPNVKAVVAGHFGVNKEETTDGIVHISTAPAPEYRIIDLINYDQEDMTIWAEVKKAE